MVKKITVKKKKRLKVSSLGSALLTMALFSFLVTTVFVRTMNQKISKEVQTIQRSITQTQVANESLNKQIDDLRNVERVGSIAKEAGLSNTNALVSVKGD